MVHNNGMAFGLFAGETTAYRAIFFTACSVGALLLILIYTIKIPLLDHRWLHIGLSLIFGGALGNIFDRVRLQYVVDFLDFHWRGFSWPAFNTADSCISIGMGLLLLDFVIDHFRHRRANN